MTIRDAKMIVGIKYCGGCNPDYDRIALVEQIARVLKRKVEFVPAKKGEVEMILAVQGCATACADLSPYTGSEVIMITKKEDEEKFIQEVNNRIP